MAPRAVLLVCFVVLGIGLSAMAALRPPSTAPRSGYGWVPEYQVLYLRGGADIYTTSENFSTDGTLEPLPSNATLRDLKFFIEPEYGIAQDWSLKLRLGYQTSSVEDSSGAATLTGAGLSDVRADVKWNLKAVDPIVTLDVILNLPLAASRPATNADLVLGDGTFDGGFLLHTGHQAGIFLFALSPGFLFRSRGYSHAIIAEAAAQLDFTRGFIRAFGNFIYSIDDLGASGTGTTASGNSAAGSGGSFSRLSAAPIGLTAGGKVGIKIVNDFYLEGGASLAMLGNRYPQFLNIQVALFNAWDFFRPLPAKRVREVPFESDGNDNFYKDR